MQENTNYCFSGRLHSPFRIDSVVNRTLAIKTSDAHDVAGHTPTQYQYRSPFHFAAATTWNAAPTP